jgi:hypothetical protein
MRVEHAQAIELSHGSSIVFGTRTSTPVFVHWFPLGVLVSRVAKQPNEALNQQLRVLGAPKHSMRIRIVRCIDLIDTLVSLACQSH